MKNGSYGRACLSIVLAWSILSSWFSPGAARSQGLPGQTGLPADPPREQVHTQVPGIEKLSADLREMLEAQEIAHDRPYGDAAAAADERDQDRIMVTILLDPGTPVQRFLDRSVTSRVVGNIQWVTGFLQPHQLRKLVSIPGVLNVFSAETFQTSQAPGLEDLRAGFPRISAKETRQMAAQGRLDLLYKRAEQMRLTTPLRSPARVQALPENVGETSTPGILDIHDVKAARAEGYTGEGVVVAVVDTGVDFSHPDLQGTQAVMQQGDYAGWPFAYDVYSGAIYAMDPEDTLGPENYWDMIGLSQYVHTFPVKDPLCDATTCSADLVLLGDETDGAKARFTWPNTSQSGAYYYSIHPDLTLPYAAYFLHRNYPEGWLLAPPLIVSDTVEQDVYDTVYVDANFDQQLTDPSERMTKAYPLAGADINQDGTWDFSAGMLTWISDGENQPPGVSTLYPAAEDHPIPAAGRLLTFVVDSQGHGTNCASEIAGQGRVTDPRGYGPINPRYAGASLSGGVGGPVIDSIAPDARIAAFQNGFSLPLDSWYLAALGMDGEPGSGDEANIISNSWGDSQTIADGWDPVSRFAHLLNAELAQDVTFLAAAGNGGHGYGTVTAPGGASILGIGASTAYGSLLGFEEVSTDQFLYGDIQPWSNRGPGALGDIAPDVVAVGAWGTGANPLNIYYGNGQSAYDVFGGTSMSTPVAAGVLALVYQAFNAHSGRWPAWEEAADLLSGSASDLGYDPLTQGAGNVQASRAVDFALQRAPLVRPTQWEAGGYHNQNYPAFPAFMAPGQQSQKTFQINNPTGSPLAVTIQAQSFEKVHEETFTFSFSPSAPPSAVELPLILEEITPFIDQYDPDMIRAQVSMPETTFDVDQDLFADNWWGVYFFDWLDRDGDDRLWNDLNQDRLVQEAEIDIDSGSGLYEFNRFTYGYPQATALEASLGREALSKKHDGVFLGLHCYFCGESTTLQIRVTFYQKTGWPWLQILPDDFEVPAASEGAFTANLSIPASVGPGSYDGLIEIHMGHQKTVIPVAAHVAASGGTFQFGGQSSLNAPYDNSHFFGGFNWNWRYEAGDWRFFYFDVPEEETGPGKSLVVETAWSDPGSDLDTWVLGAETDDFSQNDPEIFGPQGLRIDGGSAEGYLRDGKFAWGTNTGSSRELVGAPVKKGLGMLALHNVLYGGRQLAEGFHGQVYRVSSTPAQVNLEGLPLNPQEPILSASQEVTLASTANMQDGLQILPYGLSEPVNLKDQKIAQNGVMDICSSTWIYRKDQEGLLIKHGGLVEITTSSAVSDLDLDLYLFRDNGDKKWNCSRDTLTTLSAGAAADEKIKIYFPQDGHYWVVVHGNQVPSNEGLFDMRIRAIQGTNLSLRNLPLGVFRADQPVTITVSANTAYTTQNPAGLEGLLMIGPPSTPALIEVPVVIRPTILLAPQPVLQTGARWIAQQDMPVYLTVQNLGVQVETVAVRFDLPAGLVYQAGSITPTGLETTYDPVNQTLSWKGLVGGGETTMITFLGQVKPGAPPVETVLKAHIDGQDSKQAWDVETAVWLNMFGALFPMILR